MVTWIIVVAKLIINWIFMKYRKYRNLFLGLSTALFSATVVQANADIVRQAPDGGKIFQDFCSVCHGERGNGKSRASGGLIPPPRDFTSQMTTKDLSRDRMIFSVTYGRANTAMTSWEKRLNPVEIEAVVDYVRQEFMDLDKSSIDTSLNTTSKFDPEYMGLPMPFNLRAVSEWGKSFYTENCTGCHGEKGDGKGPRSDFIMPKPRDFHHPEARHKLNRPSLFKVIAEGSIHSEMPAWDKVLSYQEIAHVVEYVFEAFIEEDARTSPPAQ